MAGKQGSPFGSAANRANIRGIVPQFLGKTNMCCDEKIDVRLDMLWGRTVTGCMGCLACPELCRMRRPEHQTEARKEPTQGRPRTCPLFSFWNSPTQCRSAAASPLTTAVGGCGIAGLVGLNISLTTLMHLESAIVDELPRLNS